MGRGRWVWMVAMAASMVGCVYGEAVGTGTAQPPWEADAEAPAALEATRAPTEPTARDACPTPPVLSVIENPDPLPRDPSESGLASQVRNRPSQQDRGKRP